MNEKIVYDRLATVEDPTLGGDIVSGGIVTDVTVDAETVRIGVSLQAPYAPDEQRIADDIRETFSDIERDLDLYLPSPSTDVESPLPGVKNVIAVSSGKGGVGKTTVSVNLAAALADRGARVGLFDADLYGPNVPRMFGGEGRPSLTDEETLIPPEHKGVKLLSLAHLVPDGEAAVLRGPMVDSTLQQLLTDTEWTPLDYLVIDLPPGTGDAQLTLCQTVDITGVLLVTTPQGVAIDDARRNLSMFGEQGIPVLGIVENMRTFECPTCGDHHDLFGSGGGEKLAQEYDLPFLGSLPIDPSVRVDGDDGNPMAFGESDTAEAFGDVAARTANAVGTLRRLESETASAEGPQKPGGNDVKQHEQNVR